MADMNREEVDAKIGASEARTDSKFASVLGKFDYLIARMDKFEVELREVRTQMTNLKITVILTGVSSVLAIVLGMAGFNAALVGDVIASFDNGKDAGQWRAETNQVLAKINKQLDAMEAKQAQMSTDIDQIKQERGSGRK